MLHAKRRGELNEDYSNRNYSTVGTPKTYLGTGAYQHGITGIGEATDKVELTKTAVHNFCAEIILGQNPLQNEKLWATMYDSANYTGYMGAVDMALWDIKGKCANMPVYDLLGGKTQDSLRYL